MGRLVILLLLASLLYASYVLFVVPPPKPADVVSLEEYERIKQQAQSYDPEGSGLRFVDASYGYNCNKQLVNNKFGVRNLDGIVYDVTKNNVLKILKTLCAKKQKCTVIVSPQSMGFDPAPHCEKILEISYRCYSYTHAKHLSVRDGKKLSLSCKS